MKTFFKDTIEDYKNINLKVKDGVLINLVTIFVYLMPLLCVGGIIYLIISFLK